MDNKFSELKAAALAATLGPWERGCDNDVGPNDDCFVEWQTSGPARFDGTNAENDADFASKATPDTILALLAELKQKGTKVDELSRLLAHNIERAEAGEKRIAELETPIPAYDGSEITDARLAHYIEACEKNWCQIIHIGFNLEVARQLLAARAKTAELEGELAKREAQPVAWSTVFGDKRAVTVHAETAEVWNSDGLQVQSLFTAPPAPAVPEEQSWDELCRVNPEMTIGDAIIRSASWNACRAAMLAAAPSKIVVPELSEEDKQNRVLRVNVEVPPRALERCAAARDGECIHQQCPQLRDNEPAKSGRHCPLDHDEDEY